MTKRSLGLASLALVLLLTTAAAGALGIRGIDTADAAAPGPRTVLFASDGMRPDLMEKYAAAGAMPTYASLMAQGVRGANGLQQGFPPNTGVGWYTMATGTWPSEHGSTNNTYHRTGEGNFNNRTSLLGRGHAAGGHDRRGRRARRQEGRPDRLGRRRAGGHRRADGRLHELLLDARRARRAAERDRAGRRERRSGSPTRSRRSRRRPAGRTSRLGDARCPPQQTTLLVATTFAAQNPNRTYDVYLYDSVVNGAAALRPRDPGAAAAAAKDGSQAAVEPRGRRLQGDQAVAAPTA